MAGIIDIDKGWQNLVKMLGVGGLEVVVGFGPAVKGSDPSVAEYAGYNEFGTSAAPPRPFLRQTWESKLSAWQAQVVADLKSGLASLAVKSPVNSRLIYALALERVGLRMQSDVRQRIVDLRDPPNSPVTIKAKGSSNPLIDTGRMKGAVGYSVRGKTSGGGK